MHANMQHKIQKYAQTMLKYALRIKFKNNIKKTMMVKFINKKKIIIIYN